MEGRKRKKGVAVVRESGAGWRGRKGDDSRGEGVGGRGENGRGQQKKKESGVTNTCKST